MKKFLDSLSWPQILKIPNQSKKISENFCTRKNASETNFREKISRLGKGTANQTGLLDSGLGIHGPQERLSKTRNPRTTSHHHSKADPGREKNQADQSN